MSLKEQLEAMSTKALKRFPAEALAVMSKAAEELDAQGVGDDGLREGDLFPDVGLLDPTGSPRCVGWAQSWWRSRRKFLIRQRPRRKRMR